MKDRDREDDRGDRDRDRDREYERENGTNGEERKGMHVKPEEAETLQSDIKAEEREEAPPVHDDLDTAE